MLLGPVELIIFRFPGSEFTSGVAREINALVDSGLVRIIDMVFAMKDADGSMLVVEMDELGDVVASLVDRPTAAEADLLDASDAEMLAPFMEPNSSAAMILFENVWATKIADAVVEAAGSVMLNRRIPRAVIDQMLVESLTEDKSR